ncbi:MAG TPA: hypothetical protein VFS43_01045 [Polyangiaceae bacterium]|nr:hypothetical protein [Polyangiaceae bacterium]
MVRVSDIVGALMRGVTTARIQSDIYSAQASQSYLTDELLRSYPVPRAEIRQADVSLKVSILETVQKNIDTMAIALQTLVGDLPAYVAKVLAIPVRPQPSAPAGSEQPLGQVLGGAAAAAAEQIRAALEGYVTTNIQAFWPELSTNPKKFGSGAWKTQTQGAVAAAVAAAGSSAAIADANFTKAVAAAATAWAEAIAPAAQLAIDLALASFFDLDLAVKKDQILTLPPHVMSEFRLTFVIENYEWTTVKDKQGNTINRLTRK